MSLFYTVVLTYPKQENQSLIKEKILSFIKEETFDFSFVEMQDTTIFQGDFDFVHFSRSDFLLHLQQIPFKGAEKVFLLSKQSNEDFFFVETPLAKYNKNHIKFRSEIEKFVFDKKQEFFKEKSLADKQDNSFKKGYWSAIHFCCIKLEDLLKRYG
jgi:hypothetical protein